MDYKYEYGRYKKKVEDQQKEMERLQGCIDGMKQVLQANDAIIAAMLWTIGATKDKPLVVAQDIINMVLREHHEVWSELNSESMTHSVYVTKGGKDDVREGETVPDAEL